MKNDEKIDLSQIFRKSGFHLPIDESEIDDFEKNVDTENERPKDWENPKNILSRGKIKKIDLSDNLVDQKSANNLSMVAREGKEIDQSVRKKMDEDRKSSKK